MRAVRGVSAPILGVLAVSLVVALVSSGCASVVYKDAGSSYLAAAQTFQRATLEAAASVAKSGDTEKISRLVQDPNCPVAEARVFVRHPAANEKSFSPAFARFPDLTSYPDCQPLQACFRSGDPTCSNSCFSAQEGNCIVNIERKYRNAFKVVASQEGAVATPLGEESAAFGRILDATEVGRSRLTPNRVVADGLVVLAGYLDLVGKVVDKQESSLEADAKRLHERAYKIIEGYNDATGSDFSAGAKKTKEELGKQVAALGKLAATIQLMVDNARDAKKLKALVLTKGTAVKEVVEAIRPVASGDALLGMALSDLNALDVRAEIQSKFRAANADYERRQVVAELQSYQYGSSDKVASQLDAALQVITQAHDDLVGLVNNPSDEQLKLLRAERLSQFKQLIADTIGVVKTY